MFPVSHKTVIVLDNSYRFMTKSCGQSVDYDVCHKMKNGPPTGIIPLQPLSKSLWTTSVEAIQEYARIVYDIFPSSERLISLVTCDERSSKINMAWNCEHQTLGHLNSCFAQSSYYALNSHSSSAFSIPGVDPYGVEDSCLINGIKAAIEALSVPTTTQINLKKKNGRVINRGRIVLISNLKNEAQVKLVTDVMAECSTKYNNVIREGPNDGSRLPINECHLTILNTYPVNDTSPSSQIREMANFMVSPVLSVDVHSSRGGTMFALKLLSLVQSHFNLASTTVTGIPMKEEQNASSSANYDVEIIHPAEAHANLSKIASGAGGGDGSCNRIPKEDTNYETIPLKWCTPRTAAVELHHCSSAFRISPVDVNSRPSSCLTNFLLSGRTVMLEMTKLKGSKVMSHMLSSHNGELYIHTLFTGRSLLEDPPSISEGIGGRITDYRINDFGELMKKIKLAQIKASDTVSGKDLTPPIEKAMAYLNRQTLYWPIVLGHSIIFNIQLHIQSLLNLIPKESLTMDDVNECRNAIYQIVKMESKGTALVLPCISVRGKGPKKEELYKLLWTELDHFIEVYSTTPQHKAILSTLRELHATNDTNQTNKGGDPHSPEMATPGSPTNTSSADQPLAHKAMPILPTTIASSSSSSTSSSPSLSAASAPTPSKETQLAWKELDAYNNMSEREKRELDEKSKPVKKARTQDNHTPMDASSTASPVEGRATGSAMEARINNSNQSLLSTWAEQLNQKCRKRPEFEGRAYKIAPLYTTLNQPIE